MKYLKRVLIAIGAAGGGVAFILGHSSLTLAVIAATRYLRYWAYPTFFGINLLLTALVFLVLWPLDDSNRLTLPLFNRLMAWLGRVPWIARFFAWIKTRLAFDEGKLQRGIWPWVRKLGPFVTVLVCSFFPGPFSAAFVIRFLGLPPKKAWTYAIVTNVISTVVSISFFLGGLDGIKSYLASIFA